MGTSIVYNAGKRLNKDHPHACGDKFGTIINTESQAGSSPRVWGQVRLSYPDKLSGRIIPTRVGTRGNRSVATNTGEDHPHACGDKPVFVAAEL